MATYAAELFRDLVESSPDAQIVVDEQGVIVYANGYAHTMFGHAAGSLNGTSIDQLVPPQARAIHAEHRRHYAGRPGVREMGNRGMSLMGLRRDGTQFPAAIRLAPVRTAAGYLTAAVVRDATETEGIMSMLSAARAEADAANEAKGRFLAAASHDLRQPMQTLTLLNRVLEKMVTEPGAVAVVEHQTEALESVSGLLNALLDISKLESGAVHPSITDCSVGGIFRRLRPGFELQAKAKGLEMVVDECDDIVRTDPGLLERMIQNLVANAIRYTNTGIVRLRCLHEQGSIRIEVLDTGIGIPHDQLEAVFGDFYQVQQEYSDKREGLGLGLSIVRRLGRLLGHPVAVQSDPGRGSCFTITVPEGDASMASSSSTRLKRLSLEKRYGRILLIDDQPMVMRAARLLLELEGHEVVVASSVVEVQQMAGHPALPPDIIVSDFHLTRETTGVDAVRTLRQIVQRTIPAIFVTGDTSSAIVVATSGLPDCQVMSKPVEGDELLGRIQQLLTR